MCEVYNWEDYDTSAYDEHIRFGEPLPDYWRISDRPIDEPPQYYGGCSVLKQPPPNYCSCSVLDEPPADYCDWSVFEEAPPDYCTCSVIEEPPPGHCGWSVLEEPPPDYSECSDVEELHDECVVCFEYKVRIRRPCCQVAVCDDCFAKYLTGKVNEAIVHIRCPNRCSSNIPHEEIQWYLSAEVNERFQQYLIDISSNPCVKTCPGCKHITEVSPEQLKQKYKGLRWTCVKCELIWCFKCQAPWHDGMACKEYQRGDKQFIVWAKAEQRRDFSWRQINAQKCPKCKTYIQRIDGCNHMDCPRCDTEFCYICGDRFRKVFLIGAHQDRFSILGCKQILLPGRPICRKIVRGGLFAGAVVLGITLLALPIYGGYRLVKKIRD